jgi:hypothetical protein
LPQNNYIKKLTTIQTRQQEEHYHFMKLISWNVNKKGYVCKYKENETTEYREPRCFYVCLIIRFHFTFFEGSFFTFHERRVFYIPNVICFLVIKLLKNHAIEV